MVGAIIGAVFVIGLAVGAFMALRGPKVPDDQLTADAQEAVEKAIGAADLDKRLYVMDVEPAARRGVVTLNGAVSDEKVRTVITSSVAKVEGVRRVVDRLTLLPEAKLGAKKYAVLDQAVVNLGDGPGADEGDHLVTQGLLGMTVDLLQEKDGWYRVRLEDDGYLGWVAAAHLTIVDKAGRDAWLAGQRAVVTARTTRVYENASKGAKVLAEATIGTDLPAPAESPKAGFARVLLPGGKSGWVELAAINLFPAEQQVFAAKRGPEGVIATAKLFLGLPYLWGGTSGRGFDCSGFTQFAFRTNGYDLPRDADMQYAVGDPVPDRSQLKPGDLVYFSTYKSGPSHVGIYLGNDRYINAAGAGVVIYSFNPNDKDFNATLDKQYLGARRVIK
ncbi:MAG: NlpC/P60 family protein [Bacillota bacterium]